MNDKKRRQVLFILENKQINTWWIWSYIRQYEKPELVMEKYNKLAPSEDATLTLDETKLLIEWYNDKFKYGKRGIRS